MEPYWSTGNSVHRVDFSPDSSKLACMRISDVYVCDLRQPQFGRVIVPAQNTALTFQSWSPDSQCLAVLQRDCSVVVVSKFPAVVGSEDDVRGIEEYEDEDRRVDVKPGNLVVCCGWNPGNWLAVATDTGKVVITHDSHQAAPRWITVAYGNSISCIEATSSLWAFAVQKEGVVLHHAHDGSFYRKIPIANNGITRWLSFCPQNDNLLLIGDGLRTIVSNTSSKRSLSLNSLGHDDFDIHTLLAAGWIRTAPSPSLAIVSRDESTAGPLAVSTVVAEANGVDSAVRGVVSFSYSIPGSASIESELFSFNPESRLIVWGLEKPTAGAVLITASKYQGSDDEDTSSPRTILKTGGVSDSRVSNDGRFLALTSSEVVHVFRLLSTREQMVEYLVSPLSVWEFVVEFFFGGFLVCLLFASVVLLSSPRDVVDTVLDLFCSNHFRW